MRHALCITTKDFSLPANDGDTLWVKFVPYGTTQEAGFGMKAGGWALMFAGLATMGLAGWTGVGAFAGSAMIGTGLSMALGGTVLMNLNIPALNDREKPEQDPSIRGAGNQLRRHGRIPVLFGRHRVYPDLAANPFTSIDFSSSANGEQYYTQLFCGGYRDCVIDYSTFKLGDTPIVENSRTKDIAKIMSGQDPLVHIEVLQDGEKPSLYPACVNEQMINAVIKNKTDEGDSGAVIRNTPDKTTAIEVDVFFFNGLGKYNDSGKVGGASVEVRVTFSRTGYSSYEAISASGAELKTKRYLVSKSGLDAGEYTVKVERVTPDSTDPKVIDAVYIGSIRSKKTARPIDPERQKDLTVIALRVKAGDQLNGVIDSFNYAATSSLPAYNNSGSTGPFQWLGVSQTRNPAAMLLYALKGRAAQQRVADEDIDWPSFERFYSWCETHKYYCSAYLSEAVPISSLLRMIGATSRAEVLRIDSRISVVQDIERDSPVQLFTPKNTIGYSQTMMMPDAPDSLLLRFIDESKNAYAENSLEVYNTPDGNRIREPDTTQTIDLWGVTDSEQARRIGMYNYGCIKNRPFAHVIEADIEYLLCNKGDWVQYAGDIALAGSTQGRIREVKTENGRCTGFVTDEPIEMQNGSTYGVRIRKSNGMIILENIRTDLTAKNEIEFIAPLPLEAAPAPGDIYAFGARREEAVDLIITDIQPGAGFSATLTCVEYSPEIFNVDKPDFVLPDFANKLSPVSGAIESGVVNPSDWAFYQTFHDGDAEPPPPTGDGQNGGWHYAQTAESAWASSKTAASVTAGAWGSPVRLKGRDGKDGQRPDFRFAKSAHIDAAPAFAANADNPGNNWTDTPRLCQKLFLLQPEIDRTT